MNKTTILIAGIGGVGGYFGGLLVKQFHDSKTVAIHFLARGEHLKEIQTKGLTVLKGDETWTSRPALASDKPGELGPADVVIICTKSYDLEEMLQQLKPCIHNDTLLLPLLNGVSSSDQIRKAYPENSVADGCVYLVSRLKQAGVIENSGNIQTLYFGGSHPADEKCYMLQSLFKQAGIEATLSQDISTVIWEKFIFLSPTATATSYFDTCIGELLASEEGLSTITALIGEVTQLAKAKHITVADDMIQKTMAKLRALPFSATSSMHSDFQAHKAHTELESLTAYVIRESQVFQLETPMYLAAYTALKKKAS